LEGGSETFDGIDLVDDRKIYAADKLIAEAAEPV
jgi:hypothetical protein